MKKIILGLSFVLFPVIKTSACSLPLPVIQQKFYIERAMNSKGFAQALNKEIEKDYSISINGIEFADGLNVKLSNGCTINILLKYARPRHPGLCPEYVGEEVRTLCE